MVLDVRTLFVLAVPVAALLGALLTFSWFQNRGQRALLWWGCAYLAWSVAVSLITLRGGISDFWSVVVSNTIFCAGCGMLWNGARVFDDRASRPILMFGGAAIWTAACIVPGFVTSSGARVIVTSIILATYSFATAIEFWHGRAERLASRWPAIALLSFHATVVLTRIPLTYIMPLPEGSAIFATPWIGLVTLEGLLNAIGLAVLILAMTKERMELAHRDAAMLDPLTGIANRRAFLELATRALKQRARDRQPVAVMLFDLDRFKSVNDRFGHSAGDRVLRAFCEVAGKTLRAEDTFGRLGGEEFAALLSGVPPFGAAATAERIRAAFEAAVGEVATTTVSVGIVTSGRPGADIELLLDRADEALYVAKANGRNRIEIVDFGAESLARFQSVTPAIAAPALVPADEYVQPAPNRAV
jgi:diguanylate cyclase (GGDEF)-like protein